MITKTAKRILLALCAALTAVCTLFAISFKPTPTRAETTSALTETTLKAIDGYSGNNTFKATTGIEYVAFDGLSGDTYFLVDFEGKNAPNFAVRATQGYSELICPNDSVGSSNENYRLEWSKAGIMLWTSKPDGWNDMYVSRGFSASAGAMDLKTIPSTSKHDGSAVNIGSLAGTKDKGPGRNRFDADTRYVMLVGYKVLNNRTYKNSNGGDMDGNNALITCKVYTVDDNETLTLVNDLSADVTGITNSLTGSKAVLYGNVKVNANDTTESVTFSYAKPKASVEELISSLDGVAYQEQLMTEFGMELPSGLTQKTMSRVNVDAETKEVTNTDPIDCIPFGGFGSTFSSAYFLVDFYGQNVPNFAVNATQAYSTWDSNATYATAGLGLSLSNNGNDTYDSEALRVSNGVYGIYFGSDYYDSAYPYATNFVQEQEGMLPGLLRLNPYSDTHYVMILGLEPTCSTGNPQFIWYLFEENGGVLTQVGKLIASKNTGRPTGEYAVIYPNVNEGPEQITFQYATPNATLEGLVEGLGNGCAYKQQLMDLFAQDTETGMTPITMNRVDVTAGAASNVEYVEFSGLSGDTFFLIDHIGQNVPNFAVNATGGYDTWASNTATNGAGVTLLSSYEISTAGKGSGASLKINNGFGKSTWDTMQAGATRTHNAEGIAPGLAKYTAGTHYITIVGYDKDYDSDGQVFWYAFTVDESTKSISLAGKMECTRTATKLTNEYAVIYPNILAGATSITFSYATPKASLQELIAGLGAGYAYKTALVEYFNLQKTLTVKDEDGTTLSTHSFFGSVQLPESESANFVGYTYNGGLYPAGGVIEATTDITVTVATLDFRMVDGAAVRISSNANGVGGLRFEVRASTALVNALGSNVSVYGVLLPTDNIEGEFTEDEAGASVKELTNSVTDGADTVWYITFTNILYSNYNREFSALAYAEIEYADGTTGRIVTDYTEENNSRSAYEVALAACNDAEEYPALSKTMLHTYVGYTVNLNYTVNGTQLVPAKVTDCLGNSLVKYSVVENSFTTEADGTGVQIAFTDLPTGLLSEDGLPRVPVTFTVTSGETGRMKVRVEAYENGVATLVLPIELNPTYYYGEDKDFILYSYYAVSDGTFTDREGTENVDPSGQTLEDTQTYQEVGFNVIKIASSFWWDSETTWLKSDLKDIMDQAQSLGLKCIVSNPETTRLTESTSSLIDPDNEDGLNTFKNQSALNEYIAKQIKDIVEHEAFYGLALDDEPAYTQFAAIGEVYQAIKACAPEAFVMVNLLPYSPGHVTGGKGYYSADEQTIGAPAAYKKYLQAYYDAMGQYTKHLQYDDYPIRENETESYILDTHLVNAQMVAEFCKANDLIFDKVFQTCAGGTSSKLWRAPTQADMYWQTNIGMAMGVKTFSYWSYYPVRNVTEEYYDETASFVNKKGDKNDLYSWMQAIHEEMQDMADVLTWFDWQGMNVYESTALGKTNFYNGLTEYTYAQDVSVSVSGTGAALVTESYDEAHQQYGYFVMNVTDPTQDSTISVTVDFSGYSNVIVYQKGVATEMKLTDGETTITLTAGQGVFVLPY